MSIVKTSTVASLEELDLSCSEKQPQLPPIMQFAQLCLSILLKDVYGVELNEATGKRLIVLVNRGKSSLNNILRREEWFLDYQTENEMFLLEVLILNDGKFNLIFQNNEIGLDVIKIANYSNPQLSDMFKIKNVKD